MLIHAAAARRHRIASHREPGFVIHALAWLLIGYSDGIIYYLMQRTGISGYLVHLMPVFVLYVIGLFFTHRLQITARLVRRQMMIVVLFILVGLFQAIAVGSFYVEGYAQLFAMVSMILMLTDLFAGNADTLRPGFAKAMLAVHYIVCGYIVLSWLILHLFGLDISLFIGNVHELTDPAARVSGLHREPSWAGYAAASSYLAVYVTRRERLLLPLMTFLVATAATGAGSGLILAALFSGHQLLTAHRTSMPLRLVLLVGMVGLTVTVFGGRIVEVLNRNDASTQMRIESAIVATEVIAENFPIGTGFGNYREVADFDEELWRGFVDLDEADYYKSDLLVLNLIAELGLFGGVLVVLLLWNVFCRESLLLVAMVALLMLSAGTLILPYHLVLAAAAGLESARTRLPVRRMVPA